MVIKWWASQATTTPLFDTNFDVTLTVDGMPHVVDYEVAHTIAPGVPQMLTSIVPIPEITASSTVELKIEPKFIDSGNGVVFYYDSSNPARGRMRVRVIRGSRCQSSTARFLPLPMMTSCSIGSGETMAIDVLANDFDPEGGPLADTDDFRAEQWHR